MDFLIALALVVAIFLGLHWKYPPQTVERVHYQLHFPERLKDLG